jgi:hypothetical protein
MATDAGPAVRVHGADWCRSHARALFLPEGVGNGPPEAFQRGREFAHLHPHHDGSLHVTLPEVIKDQVEGAGRGVRHPTPEHNVILGLRAERPSRARGRMAALELSYEHAMGRIT